MDENRERNHVFIDENGVEVSISRASRGQIFVLTIIPSTRESTTTRDFKAPVFIPFTLEQPTAAHESIRISIETFYGYIMRAIGNFILKFH